MYAHIKCFDLFELEKKNIETSVFNKTRFRPKFVCICMCLCVYVLRNCLNFVVY